MVNTLLECSEKPTPLGVGWIAQYFYKNLCMLALILYTY
nr:MAG TPA: hypothetical protein [Caudoviricetes sp.]